MKHVTAFAVAVCVFASFALAGTGLAQDHAAKASIPFNFNVGDKWIPAGNYLITSSTTNPKVLHIQSEDGKVSLLSLVSEDDGQRLTAGKLVFTKYGDQYFLHEILCSACGMNVQFPGSKHETLARKRLEAGLSGPSDVYLAVNHRQR